MRSPMDPHSQPLTSSPDASESARRPRRRRYVPGRPLEYSTELRPAGLDQSRELRAELSRSGLPEDTISPADGACQGLPDQARWRLRDIVPPPLRGPENNTRRPDSDWCVWKAGQAAPHAVSARAHPRTFPAPACKFHKSGELWSSSVADQWLSATGP